MGQVMAISKRSASSLHTVAGHAEHVYSVAEGATSPPGIEEVSSSWQRSANKYRVDPVDTLAPRILTSGELKDFREPLDKLIFSAQEEIDQLYKVVREAGYTVLFCDSSGVAVEHRGDDAQASRFEYWGTWLGGVWSEEVEGTNGIGTCIVEERPVTVHRGQHFRSRHIDLSCSGAPVFGADGRLMAVLDVSAIDPELSERAHALTGALTVRSARAIEERFFREQFRREWIVAVAPPEGGAIGMLLAIDGNQRIVGANRAARTSLLLDDRGLRAGVSLWTIFERDLDLFRRKDRTDIYTLIGGRRQPRQPPRACDSARSHYERLEQSNESAYAPAPGFDPNPSEALASTASTRRTVGRRDASGTGIHGSAFGRKHRSVNAGWSRRSIGASFCATI